MNIPMLDLKAEYLYMKHDIDAAISRCLEHQQWIFGPEVKELEDKLAEYIGVKHCIGTSSGTDALVLALRVLAIKRKGQEYFDRSDLIITTPFTFTATGDAILRAGATPLFVDINPFSYNIDPEQIRYALNHSTLTAKSPRVVGIVPVHLYGQSCQMDNIMSLANENELFVVEDCAQAIGSKSKMSNCEWQMVGSIGDMGCFSFFPSKNLGGFGDAGAITTNDDELESLIRMLVKHGGKTKYNVEYIGYNARIDTFQAAILLAKLKYIDEFNNRRRRIAQIYIESLQGIDGLVLPNAHRSAPITDEIHVFHQFTVRILNGQRNFLQALLKDFGIDSTVYYPIPLNRMKVFEGKCVLFRDLKQAEKAAEEVLSLPIEPLSSEERIFSTVNCLQALSNSLYNPMK